MGLQTSTLAPDRAVDLSSTYVTGVLDTLAKSIQRKPLSVRRYSPEVRPAAANSSGSVSPSLARRAASVWFSYAGGAIALGSAGLLVFKAGDAGRPDPCSLFDTGHPASTGEPDEATSLTHRPTAERDTSSITPLAMPLAGFTAIP